ncbi:hypothetical protein MY1884_008633 [Beauveria asiatica]
MNHYTNSAGLAWSAPPQTPPHHVSLRNLEQTLAALQLGDQLVYESQTQSYRFALFRFRRDDGSRIAVKVQQQWPIATHPDNMQTVVRRELYALKKLESIHFKYAPKCIAYDTSFDNPIRMPFLVVTWTEGEPLTWTTHYPPMDMRMRVLNQLFQIQLELIEDSLESCNETARHFYSRLIHDKMMIAPRGPPGIGSIPTQEDYWSQLAQLECVLGPAQDEKTYAIAHNNLVPDNIIVDREHNIEWYNASLHLFHLAHSANVKDSLVGWSFGGLYPLSQAAILPRFLAPAVGIEDAASARQIAHAAVGDKTQYRHPLNVYNLAPTPGRQAMLRWQNGDDADFRALYLLSMKHRDVHAWLARHRWRPPHCQAWQDVGRMPQPQPRPAAPIVLQSRPQQHVHETLFDAVRRVPECRNPLTRAACVLALQRLRLRLEPRYGNRKTELVVRSVKEPVRAVKGRFEEACGLVLGIQSHDRVLNTLYRFAKTVAAWKLYECHYLRFRVSGRAREYLTKHGAVKKRLPPCFHCTTFGRNNAGSLSAHDESRSSKAASLLGDAWPITYFGLVLETRLLRHKPLWQARQQRDKTLICALRRGYGCLVTPRAA